MSGKPTTRSAKKKAELLAKDGAHEKLSSDEANADDELVGLDPDMSKVFLAMREHITKIIDDKLGPLLQTVQVHIVTLQDAEKRLDEAEERPSPLTPMYRSLRNRCLC